MKHFVPNNLGFKVLTPDGYKDFAGISLMGEKQIFRITFSNNRHIECTFDHKFICPHGIIALNELRVGDFVYRGDGRRTKVKEIIDTGRIEPVYDLIEVDGGHRYVANGIVSSNCEFITDDETLIDPMVLSNLEGMEEPVFYTGTVRWFVDPEPNRTYLVALDPSLGTGRDYSAIQVFSMPDLIQVAEWQHNKSAPREQVRMLMQILNGLDMELSSHPEQVGDPDIYWTVENNSIGEAILQIIEDTGEERFAGEFISEKKRKGQVRRFRKGLNTDNRKKLSACARLKSLVESYRMEVNSTQLIRQFKNFVAKESSFSAKPGEHDDLVSSTLLVVRMLDVVLTWGGEQNDNLKEYISDDELYGEDDALPVVF